MFFMRNFQRYIYALAAFKNTILMSFFTFWRKRVLCTSPDMVQGRWFKFISLKNFMPTKMINILKKHIQDNIIEMHYLHISSRHSISYWVDLAEANFAQIIA